MINIEKKQNCCGCNACMNICPKHCIEMVCDGEGFLYPVVHMEKCMNCGLCDKACPIQHEDNALIDKDSKEPDTYAMINMDEEIREKSSSGGIFTLVAEKILENNGVVFGAAMADDCRSVVHIGIESREGLELLRGSKYLQSSIGESYRQVKRYLEDERMVLFTGTPCQIEGLKTYLGKEYENLICMDLICHGVPSPKVWRKYVEFREAGAGSPAQRTVFRHKKFGWKQYAVLFEFSNNTAYLGKLNEDIYMKAFLQDICLRPSCYNCRFKKVDRVSDITVADFWGIQKILPEMDDDKGTSLVMVHSKKGQQILDKIADQVICKEVPFDVVPRTNPAMMKPAKEHKNREKFFTELDIVAFDKLVKKYAVQKITVKGLAVRVLRKIGLLEFAKKVIGR